jgi:hypothetical protein
MGVKQQQGRSDQPSLFEWLETDLRHDTSGEGVTGAGMSVEGQASTASEPARALTDRLMEEVCRLGNLNEAYHRVVSNKGKPGIDGMTVDDLSPWLGEHRQTLLSSLLDGSYRPRQAIVHLRDLGLTGRFLATQGEEVHFILLEIVFAANQPAWPGLPQRPGLAQHRQRFPR